MNQEQQPSRQPAREKSETAGPDTWTVGDRLLAILAIAIGLTSYLSSF